MSKTGSETPPCPLPGSDNELNQAHSHMGGESELPKKRGRPKGSKNATTLLQEAIRNDFTKLARRRSRQIFEKLTEKAKEGDMQAMKIFMDKILPNAQSEVHKTSDVTFGVQIVINDMKPPESNVIEGEVVND